MRSGIDDLESALERSDTALAVAEKADEFATGRGRGVMKLLLVLTLLGIAVLVVRKVMSGGSGASDASADTFQREQDRDDT